MKEEDAAELKALKDYALVRGELYCRMPGGVLSDVWDGWKPREN